MSGIADHKIDAAGTGADYAGYDLEGFLAGTEGFFEGEWEELAGQHDALVKSLVKAKLNALIDALLDDTDGESGADNIGATKLTGGTAETVQGILEELDAKGASELNAEIPSADTSVTGTTTELTNGAANLAFGDVCYIDASFNTVFANATAVATSFGLVMAAENITASEEGKYLLYGVARNDAWNWSAGPIYLSATGTTGNTLTQTAPSGTGNIVQIIGYALSADAIFFNPQLVQVEVK